MDGSGSNKGVENGAYLGIKEAIEQWHQKTLKQSQRYQPYTKMPVTRNHCTTLL